MNLKRLQAERTSPPPLVTNLDIEMIDRGYRLLDFTETEGYVFMVGGRSLAKQLQSLPDELIEKYTYDDESW